MRIQTATVNCRGFTEITLGPLRQYCLFIGKRAGEEDVEMLFEDDDAAKRFALKHLHAALDSWV